MSVTVLASRFNSLVNRINAILGVSTSGAPTTGYGQTNSIDSIATVTGTQSDPNACATAISNPSAFDKITADQYMDLYINIVRARIHQAGAGSVSINPFVVGGTGDCATASSADKITESYMTSLESLMTTVETNKLAIDITTQATIENLKNASNQNIESVYFNALRGPWNTQLFHIFTVTFSSALARRHFFNSGGQIRFSASLTNYTGSQPKTLDWQDMLNTMGVISFTANNTFSNASIGTGSSVGNYQLTSTYQLSYSNFGIYYAYTGNIYQIDALQVNDSTIQFRVSFRDIQVENVDEPVFGDLRSTIQIARPDGEAIINGTTYDTVVITPAPIGSTTTDL